MGLMLSQGSGVFAENGGSTLCRLIGSGGNNIDLGDARWTSNIVTYNSILPSGTLNIGSGTSAFNGVYCVALYQSSNADLKTDITDAPSLLDIALSLPVKTFRWKVGGADTVETEEQEQVQATTTVTEKYQETQLGPDGKAILVEKTREIPELLFDKVPVHDESGQPVFEIVPAKPAALNSFGEVVQPAVPEKRVPRFHYEPRMTTRAVKVQKQVARAGKRIHIGALAADIKDAFTKTTVL